LIFSLFFRLFLALTRRLKPTAAGMPGMPNMGGMMGGMGGMGGMMDPMS